MITLICGHSPEDGAYWIVDYPVMVNNLDGGDGDPALVEANCHATAYRPQR